MGADIDLFAIPCELEMEFKRELNRTEAAEERAWEILERYRFFSSACHCNFRRRLGIEDLFCAWQSYSEDDDNLFLGQEISKPWGVNIRFVNHSKLKSRLNFLRLFEKFHRGTLVPEVVDFIDKFGHLTCVFLFLDTWHSCELINFVQNADEKGMSLISTEVY